MAIHARRTRRSFGLLEITMRGQGKSYRCGALAYIMTISYRKSHVGLQSKSDPDVEELFSQKIAEPMKDLPDFLVPINSHGTDPQSGLRFFAPPRAREGYSNGSKRGMLKS